MLQNSGHLRVTVSPQEVKIEYVRAYLSGDGTNGIGILGAPGNN